jgi:hypothetical protein
MALMDVGRGGKQGSNTPPPFVIKHLSTRARTGVSLLWSLEELEQNVPPRPQSDSSYVARCQCLQSRTRPVLPVLPLRPHKRMPIVVAPENSTNDCYGVLLLLLQATILTRIQHRLLLLTAANTTAGQVLTREGEKQQRTGILESSTFRPSSEAEQKAGRSGSNLLR